MLKRFAAAVTVALVLSACASAPTRIALEPAAKQKLNEVKVLSVLPQDEVIARAETLGASVALGGGLIGAMIDSNVAESRQNALQDMLAPFYGAVDDFDYRPSFQQALTVTLSNGMPVPFSATESSALLPLKQNVDTRLAALSHGGGLLLVFTTYAFTSDFTRLNLVTHASLHLPGVKDPVFKNTFYYQSTARGAGAADSVKTWSANQGATYRAALNEATQQITRMLAMDLVAGASDPADAPKITLQKVDGPQRNAITGNVLATGVDRSIIRNTAGNMYSLPQ
jgi:hypothetical protein